MDAQHIAQVLHRRSTAKLVGIKTPRRRLPRQQQPDLIRGRYAVELRRRVVEPMRRSMSLVMSVLPGLLASVRAAAEKHDAGETPRAHAALEAASRRFFSNFGTQADLARSIGQETSTFQKAQLDRQIRAAVGVSLPIADRRIGPKLEAFTAENVRLIKTIPTRFFGEVEKLVLDGVAEGRRWESLSVDIQERFDVSESRADLIASDQVGKLFGALAEARQTELGIAGYIWRTAKDERTCPICGPLDGDYFEWTQGPIDGHPGEIHPRCRCYAEPDLETAIESLE